MNDIIRNADDLKRQFVSHGNVASKRQFPKTNDCALTLDRVVFEWFCRARSHSLPVSGPILQEKALEISKKVGMDNFKASNGWLQRFRERHCISFKNVCAQGNSVDKTIVDNWSTKLKHILNGYEAKSVYNCDDQTGLFFRALPRHNKTLCLKDEDTGDGCHNVSSRSTNGKDEKETCTEKEERDVEEKPILTYEEARKSIENIKAYCLDKEDSIGLIMAANIQIHLEKQQVLYSNSQSKITDLCIKI